jgi:hypothetical protein
VAPLAENRAKREEELALLQQDAKIDRGKALKIKRVDIGGDGGDPTQQAARPR